MDGVYFGQGRVINEGFFDLAGLEVLKGPQSLFYGKNATAGVISINTANPTSTFQARTRVSYELNAKQPSVQGFVSGPVTETQSEERRVGQKGVSTGRSRWSP